MKNSEVASPQDIENIQILKYIKIYNTWLNSFNKYIIKNSEVASFEPHRIKYYKTYNKALLFCPIQKIK